MVYILKINKKLYKIEPNLQPLITNPNKVHE